ncbi:hypothetical protein AYX14_06707 [Cryptococcus neoformans]|nr:hypothetical protein AYX15_06735 [Cryptococcus neoformans var. grubii]OWZ63483.1 hypothetical protein AYX14_06707 [Cryptococcus neoformans var. grubii]
MFARSLIRTTATTMPVARTMMARKITTAAPAQLGPIRAFFRDVPIPVDAYPLIGIVVIMCSGATYSTFFFIFSRIYSS